MRRRRRRRERGDGCEYRLRRVNIVLTHVRATQLSGEHGRYRVARRGRDVNSLRKGLEMNIAKLALIAATLLGASLVSDAAYAGCYRMGPSGYHHYRSCVGPGFLYPHHRHCRRHRGCWYH